jgi:acetylglutamate kinase
LLPATPIDARLGRAGTPLAPATSLIRVLLAAGFLPVISPVATDSTSTLRAPLNVNGDDAAAAIAAALGAELWMIADVEGVLDAGRAVIQGINAAQLASLVTEGTVNKGMHAKLEAGFAALEAGAPGVRIASLEGLSNVDSGTFLSLT